MQFILLFLFFVIQTTVFRNWYCQLDLFLFLLVLCAAGRGINKGLFWGVVIGFFLDIFSSPFYYHIFVYGITGFLLGLIPAGIFRSYRSLAISALIFATLLSYLFISLTSRYFFNHFNSFHFGYFLLILSGNILLAYVLSEPLGRYLGINVKTQ